MAKHPKVDDAYALRDAGAVRQLYADWAQTYDTGFGQSEGYQLPREVALAFVSAGGVGPVLDFGAGTGLVAEDLATFNVAPVDAVDISRDMLDVAAAKGIYRDLYAADLLAEGHGIRPSSYDGIVSAGTLTLGHVGPEALLPLIELAAIGAVFALSVNTQHFAQAGFDAALADLSDRITDLNQTEVRIYDDRADATHRDDTALIITFRKR